MKDESSQELKLKAWNLAEYSIRRAVDWVFRGRSTGRYLIRAGLATIVTVFGGSPLMTALVSLALGYLPEQYKVLQQAIDSAGLIILAICGLLLLVGITLEIRRANQEADALSKTRVVVFEARGLRNDDGSSLAEAVRKDFSGSQIPVLLDLRNNLDGKVIEPNRAINNIVSAHNSLLQHQKGVNRTDLTTVYAGLTSVPYTFLTGILFDDEGQFVTYDWDRSQEKWRALNGEDDGKKFAITGLEAIGSPAEAVLAVAFSYPIVDSDLQRTFSCPVVRMILDGMSSSSHWSASKQNRLAQEFLEVAKSLAARDVKKIHLVLAAPNSVVFNFGRRYDKRNLPEVVVYQYERGGSPAYPWGIIMPVSGIDSPSVLKTG